MDCRAASCLEPRIGGPPSAEWAAVVAEAKQHCYALGWNDFALSLPDSEKVKTPLTAANQLRRCLDMLAAPPGVNGETLSPPAVAKLLRVSSDTVLDWIKKRELPASNLAQRGKRPRWAVKKDDLQRFLKNRQPDPLPEKPRRRREPDDVIEFF